MEIFWEKYNWEASDKHLAYLEKMPFRRPFPVIPSEPGVYVIRGPRQIGKSSWLKTLLSGHVKAGRKCFYLSCENLRDHVELVELLKSLRNREIILLDEISFVKEWSRAIKHVVDSGYTNTFVLTGSHAADLRRGIDQMPGRWGAGGEYHLLPMQFDEFSQMRAMAKWPKLERVKELELYFRVGGFPSALYEAGPEGETPKAAMRTCLQWLKGDVVKLGKQEIYLKEILGQIVKTTGTTISLQTLAQKTQIGSHHTALDYVNILDDCFALRTVYAIDKNDSSFRFKKQKKFYFTDPLIYWIAIDWCGIRTPQNATEQIAEMVANEALQRRYKRFGYFSSAQGEVDFLSPSEWAIEVKWTEAVNNLSSAYKGLVVPEKIVWSKQNFLLEWPIQ